MSGEDLGSHVGGPATQAEGHALERDRRDGIGHDHRSVGPDEGVVRGNGVMRHAAAVEVGGDIGELSPHPQRLGQAEKPTLLGEAPERLIAQPASGDVQIATLGGAEFDRRLQSWIVDRRDRPDLGDEPFLGVGRLGDHRGEHPHDDGCMKPREKRSIGRRERALPNHAKARVVVLSAVHHHSLSPPDSP